MENRIIRIDNALPPNITVPKAVLKILSEFIYSSHYDLLYKKWNDKYVVNWVDGRMDVIVSEVILEIPMNVVEFNCDTDLIFFHDAALGNCRCEKLPLFLKLGTLFISDDFKFPAIFYDCPSCNKLQAFIIFATMFDEKRIDYSIRAGDKSESHVLIY